ncbi:MAG: hypothetical protein HY293_09395 [Planctomycetes bacterium]|nr:hypothetical protein [Planctomycetota bacterium]
MTRPALLLVFLPLLAGFRAGDLQVVARHGRSLRATYDGVPLLALKGSAAERGRAHGFLCARDIQLFIDAFVPVVKSRKSGDWDKDILPAARHFVWPKRFEEELAAMLAGIREALPDPRARTLKNLGRELSVDDLKVMNAVSDLFGMGCSSFSAWGELTEDGQVLTGRNGDYATFAIPFSFCLVALQPSEKDLKATLSVGAMGLIASGTVMNSEGVFAALHDEAGLPREKGAALQPRLLSVQAAVEAARADHAVEDVAQALRRSPVAVGNNIHVSAPIQSDRPETLPAVLEWDGNSREQGVTVRGPRAEEFRTALACTNHYRARAERNSGCGRYASLSEALRRAASEKRKIDVAAAQQMMDAVAPQGGTMTYLSVIVFPKQRRMVVALASKPGVSATKGRWTTADWDAVFRN